jgi:hypothetical protein
MALLSLKPETFTAIVWSPRPPCGERGCSDPECLCGLCRLPIGVADDDSRWQEHSEFCMECELCRDQVPAILFRGEGKTMEEAQFHWSCFTKLVRVKSQAAGIRVINHYTHQLPVKLGAP